MDTIYDTEGQNLGSLNGAAHKFLIGPILPDQLP